MYQTLAISLKLHTPYTTHPTLHSCVARLGGFPMLYDTKTGVGDCVNSYLVKIPASQAVSPDGLIRCLVLRCVLNERS